MNLFKVVNCIQKGCFPVWASFKTPFSLRKEQHVQEYTSCQRLQVCVPFLTCIVINGHRAALKSPAFSMIQRCREALLSEIMAYAGSGTSPPTAATH